MSPLAPIALLLTLFAAACGRDGGGASFGGASEPNVTTVPVDTDDMSSNESSSSSSSGVGDVSTGDVEASSSGVSGASTFDMPTPPDYPDPLPVGCQGKIDFLFVVSSAGTMKFHQQQLADSFDPFMAAIEAKLPDFDVHVLSATTDIGWKFNDCSDCAGEGCDPAGMLPLCGAEREDCDEVRGAGVRFPVGTGASNELCALDEGNRYINGGETDLNKKFSCIAKVGINGSSLTAESMVAALSAESNGPDGCNEGFLRDDALLMVTIFDDGYDEFSSGDVDSWIEALRTAKHGDDHAYMVLVLTTDVDLGGWELCHPGMYNQTKNRLRLFANAVEHGSIASICAPSYGEFFASTVEEVVELCEGFIPPPG